MNIQQVTVGSNTGFRVFSFFEQSNFERYAHFLVIAFITGLFTHTISAQGTKPPAGAKIIFDDFNETSTSVLWGNRSWTDLDGQFMATERFWYKGSWGGQSFDTLTDVSIYTNGTQKYLKLGLKNNYTQSYAVGKWPPLVVSGFTARTGTWVAQVRLDKIQKGGAGSVTTKEMIQAFWTMSPSAACIPNPNESDNGNDFTCPKEQKFWSEFDQEWNNWFEDTTMSTAYRQLVSSTGFTNGHTGTWPKDASRMKDPRTSSSPEGGRDCYQTNDGINFSNNNPVECMDNWFVSNADSTKLVDLLIQYDGDEITFAATGYDFGFSPAELVYMDTTATLGTAQPMMIMMSNLLRDGVTADDDFSMFVDWVYYSEDTSVSIWTVRDHTEWLQANNRSRVNTTGKSLAARTGAFSIALETPIEHISGKEEWIVVPSVQDENNLYDVTWKYRTKLLSTKPWTIWSTGSDEGFAFTEKSINDFYAMEVKVTVADWDSLLTNPSQTACLQVYNATIETVCEGSGAKRGDDFTESEIEDAVETELPTVFALHPSFPNPFNSTTRISFDVPKISSVSVSVYDIAGRLVTRLINSRFKPGTHSVAWNTNGESSGVYLIRMKASSFTTTTQVTLLK